MDQVLLESRFGGAIKLCLFPRGCSQPEAPRALLSQPLQSQGQVQRAQQALWP